MNPFRLPLFVVVLCVAATAARAQELPQFIVPGQEREMRLLEELYARHHSPRTNCTLWDAWLPMSTLWPAVGPEGKATAQPLRDFYRRSLTRRHIDPEGYVAMNQHRGLAHPGGWPFPTWRQAGGVGWHFTHAGDAYAQQLHIPLADLTGWETEGVTGAKVDRERGLRFSSGAGETSLTTPPFSTPAYVAPFVVIEWSADRLSEDAQPYLEWTTDSAPEFSAERRVAVPLDTEHAAQYGGQLRLSTVTMHRHPQWRGKITQLRIGWANAKPADMTLRSVHTACDTRHPITGSLFIRGCADYFNWTGDVEFLRANMGRMRTAIEFALEEFAVAENGCVVVPWVGHDGRAGFDVKPDGTKQIHHGHGIGNNYWDLLPFGHKDFLATLYLYDALNGLAELEEAVAEHPQWQIANPSPELDASRLRSLAQKVRRNGQELFWNPTTRRFVACIDADGKTHDYGFTFLNLEAVYYGLASDQQAQAILAWVDGERTVAGDTSSGEDIYHWRFAPRSTTRRNVDWYGWVWHSPETIPWGGQVQDGGAVLGFSFHDLMARLKTRGPDDAWQRLQEILDWFAEVQQEGGYRKYYAKPGRGSLQGGGTPGGLGIDHEFLESVLLPQVMLYGFLGFEPTPDGIQLNPRLPHAWSELMVTRIHYRDHVFDLRVAPDVVEVTFRNEGSGRLPVELPEGDNRSIEYRR